MVTKLRYGNTNTFYISGDHGGLLIDTDYAGTLPQFFRAIKSCGIQLGDISYMLATHYHPDHIGLTGALQSYGVRLLLIDVQQDSVHFADRIFAREKGFIYKPIQEDLATVIRCEESRAFLDGIGISGEIIHTPSHSEDSISVILDNGTCIVGDLEPLEYLSAYESNPKLQKDWDQIMHYHPQRICYAHVNEREF